MIDLSKNSNFALCFLRMNLKPYTKEFRYNLHLATPVILGMLGHTLVGFIDNAMVGKLGTTELAAVALGNSIIFLVMVLGIGFSTAITPFTAEAYSANDVKQKKSILKHGLFSCSMLSILLLPILFFAEDIMHATKQDQEVINLALPYVQWVAISLIPLMVFQALKQFSDGLSLTKYPMYVTIIGNVVNVILNYLFIYGTFGCPKLGVLGAAVGTLASRFIMPFLLWFILIKNPKTQLYFIGVHWRKIHWKPIKKLIYIGVPSALQMISEAGVFIAATWISGALGKNYQASNQIALSLASLTFIIASGLSIVAMIRVSNFKGLNDYINLRRVAISVFLFTLLCQITLALAYITFREWIPAIFLDTNDISSAQDITFVIENAKKLLLIAGIFQISDGLQVVALGALRGFQDVKIPMIISLIAYWIICFPISYYLGLYTTLNTMGIWIGLLVGLTVAAILLTARFLHISKKMIRLNHS